MSETEQWQDAYLWMLSLAAWSAYKRYSALLSGNQSPRQREDYERITTPVIGDLVLEIGTVPRSIGWENWEQLDRSLGVLLDKQPERGHPGCFEYTVLSLSPDPTWTFWTNCTFVVVETPPFMPVCPHCHGNDPENCPKKRRPFHPDNEIEGYCANGRWAYPVSLTRESLTRTLAQDGFEVTTALPPDQGTGNTPPTASNDSRDGE